MTISSVSLAFMNGPAHPLFVLAVGLNFKRLLKKIRKLPKHKSMRSRQRNSNLEKKTIWCVIIVGEETMSMFCWSAIHVIFIVATFIAMRV